MIIDEDRAALSSLRRYATGDYPVSNLVKFCACLLSPRRRVSAGVIDPMPGPGHG